MLFNGVAKSGRVWRKVPESDARSVGMARSVVVFDWSPRYCKCSPICLAFRGHHCNTRFSPGDCEIVICES